MSASLSVSLLRWVGSSSWSFAAADASAVGEGDCEGTWRCSSLDSGAWPFTEAFGLDWAGEETGSGLPGRGGEFIVGCLGEPCCLLIREDDDADDEEDEEESRIKDFEGVSGSDEWSMSTSEADADRTLDMATKVVKEKVVSD